MELVKAIRSHPQFNRWILFREVADKIESQEKMIRDLEKATTREIQDLQEELETLRLELVKALHENAELREKLDDEIA
jgi:hypothetical protein